MTSPLAVTVLAWPLASAILLLLRAGWRALHTRTRRTHR